MTVDLARKNHNLDVIYGDTDNMGQAYYGNYWDTRGANAYASMGDIDWAKRSAYDNWISPKYTFSSMADYDWGWKKRGDADVVVKDEEAKEEEEPKTAAIVEDVEDKDIKR